MNKDYWVIGIVMGVGIILVFLFFGHGKTKGLGQGLLGGDVGRYELFFSPNPDKQVFLVDTLKGLTWKMKKDTVSGREKFSALTVEGLAIAPVDKLDNIKRMSEQIKKTNPNYKLPIDAVRDATKYKLEQ